MSEDTTLAAVTDKLMGVDLSMNTEKVLMVSTGHITEQAMKWLVGSWRPAMKNDEGVIVGVWPDAGGTERDEIEAYPELYKLFEFAAVRGYTLLWLDADGPFLPLDCGLPTFSW